MKTNLFLLILVSVSILSVSCTKKLRYTKEELFSIAKSKDPTLEFILPKTINDGVQCSDYLDGCVAGHRAKVQGLEMIAVEFMTEQEARNAAKKINGYYVRNWTFDDVNGEPILEKFVQESLKAKRP